MAKIYSRKEQDKIDDLYDVLLHCVNSDYRYLLITDDRYEELLAWLWGKHSQRHVWGKEDAPHLELKRMDIGDVAPSPPLPRRRDNQHIRDHEFISLYLSYCRKYRHERNPGEKAKDVMEKELGIKREALEKAIGRANKRLRERARQGPPAKDSDPPF
jgi:hypothetical protein